MMITRNLPLTAAALALTLLAGCATPVAQPAFYPNAYYQQVGPEQARLDADACAQLAQQSQVGSVNKMDAAHSAAAGAAGVGTAGLVGSVLSGSHDLKGVAIGAVAVGAGGAAATAAGQSVSGSPLYRQFVQQCLAERGYRVIGWH